MLDVPFLWFLLLLLNCSPRDLCKLNIVYFSGGDSTSRQMEVNVEIIVPSLSQRPVSRTRVSLGPAWWRFSATACTSPVGVGGGWVCVWGGGGLRARRPVACLGGGSEDLCVGRAAVRVEFHTFARLRKPARDQRPWTFTSTLQYSLIFFSSSCRSHLFFSVFQSVLPPDVRLGKASINLYLRDYGRPFK